jgi:hypothetical protein
MFDSCTLRHPASRCALKSAKPGLGCDRTTARVTSPTAEAMRSDRIQSEFKSPVTHHPASRCALRRMPSEALAEEGICPRSPIGRGPGLNPGQCGFDARRGYARVAQRQRQRLQTPLSGRSNRPSRTKQRSLRSPSGQRHRSYTPTFRGSNPRRSTTCFATGTRQTRDRRVAQWNQSVRLRSGRPGVRVTPRRPCRVKPAGLATPSKREGAASVRGSCPQLSAIDAGRSVSDPCGLISRVEPGATPGPATSSGSANKGRLVPPLRCKRSPQCREPEVRITIAASPIANFGFKAALES